MSFIIFNRILLYAFLILGDPLLLNQKVKRIPLYTVQGRSNSYIINV